MQTIGPVVCTNKSLQSGLGALLADASVVTSFQTAPGVSPPSTLNVVLSAEAASAFEVGKQYNFAPSEVTP